jgi:single-stranded-DNA-specific exonuclease
MSSTAKHWRLVPADNDLVHSLSASLGCSDVIARLLVQRGVVEEAAARRFLDPGFHQLPDPFLLPDAELAVERLRQAISSKERIFVHGDYDGDGVTSAALWTRLLQRLGADVLVHVPHRRHDGYDMRAAFVQRAKEAGAKLILTTDCGIQRCEEVEQARQAGIDVVITDHHEPPDELPRAVAVVNPHRVDSDYPFPHLAGVGVAYRLGEALIQRLGHSVDSYRRAYGDLAAIGTVTDVMPLMEDNRVIVKQGLAALSTTNKPGLQALMHEAKIPADKLTAYRVGYQLGPRLNAIGRVDDARFALELLLARDAPEAIQLAAQLEKANFDRRLAQAKVLEEALRLVDTIDVAEHRCLVIAGAGWHHGVLGLVANRLVEQYNRPSIVISTDAETGLGRGSARSIRTFDLFEAISVCGDLLEEFGGHQHAAGFSIRADRVPEFQEAMAQIADELLTDEDLQPVLDVDAEVPVESCSMKMLEEMMDMEPCGRGNERARMVCRGVRVAQSRRIGAEGKHLKLLLHTGAQEPLDAIWWGQGDRADGLGGGTIDVCFRLEENNFNGRIRPQMVLEDLRTSG